MFKWVLFFFFPPVMPPVQIGPAVFAVRARERIPTGVTDRGSEVGGVMKWLSLYQSVSHLCHAGGP